MYCKNCGNPLSPDSRFCPTCGQTINTTNEGFYQNQQGVTTNYDVNQNQSFQEDPNKNFQGSYEGPFNYNQYNGNKGFQNGYEESNISYQNGALASKKSNPIFVIIIVILACAIIGVGAYLILSKQSGESGSKTEIDPPTPTKTEIDPPTPTKTEEDISEGETLSVSGYKFNVINKYRVKNTTLGDALISNELKTAIYVFIHKNYSFSLYKSSVVKLKQQLENEGGVKISKYETKTVDGVELLILYGTIATSNGKYSFVDVYSALGTYDVGEYLLYSYTSKNAKSFLSDIAKVVKSAKYTGSSSFAPGESENQDIIIENHEFIIPNEFMTDEINVLDEEE